MDRSNFDIQIYNAEAWDSYVENGVEWTLPVTSDQIVRARQGDWSVGLTQDAKVPQGWFPEMKGLDVLSLAGGGGQQGPIFAAAGANVTVMDLSPAQLARDRMVADREGLTLKTVEGDMRDLSCFSDASFDLVFHPIANCYVPDILPIWAESFRVLRPGGCLLSGLVNPIVYLFDFKIWEEEKKLVAAHRMPYSDLEHATDEDFAQYMKDKTAMEFSHCLHDAIGGQLRAGFVLTGFYEDDSKHDLLAEHLPVYFATKAEKPIIEE